MAYFVGIAGGFGLMLIGALVIVLSQQIRRGGLARNSLFGLRTRNTKATDESWRAGHAAAEPILRRLGPGIVLAGFIPLVVAWWTRTVKPSSAMVVTVNVVEVLFFVAVALLLWACVVANRAARDQLQR